MLATLADVPRAAYVPAASVREIEADRPIPIGGAQVTTQPSLVAAMVAALALEGSERVLEVSTGLGYQAAILARLAREVWTLERRPELAQAAERHLAAQGVENVHVELADGSAGLVAHAPYDAIVVAAAHPQVPAPLVAQLAPGGSSSRSGLVAQRPSPCFSASPAASSGSDSSRTPASFRWGAVTNSPIADGPTGLRACSSETPCSCKP